mgnify:CR=1 FL=1
MEKQQRCYLSYLLHLWQTSDGRRQVWRASLESPGTGERQGFASLENMFDFLVAQTDWAQPDYQSTGLPIYREKGVKNED